MTETLLSVHEWKQKSNGTNNRVITDTLKRVYTASTIYSRFDALCELIDQCEQFIDHHPDQSPVGSILKEKALNFAMAIVDAKNRSDLEKKIADRNKYKSIDPEYMPWLNPPSRTDVTTVSNRQDYVREAIRNAAKHTQNTCKINSHGMVKDKEYGVSYLTDPLKREKYRIFPSNGKLKKISSQGIGERQQLTLQDFDTSTYSTTGFSFITGYSSSKRQDNKAIFVISPKGDFYAGSKRNRQFHHSTFLAGRNVFYGGTMSVMDGELRALNDHTGHYAPEVSDSVRALAFFRKTGLLNNKLSYQMWNPDAKRRVEYPIYLFNLNATQSLKKKLIANIDRYISSRAYYKDGELQLNWVTRKFRDPILTLEKIGLAIKFKKAVLKANDMASLKKLVDNYHLANESCENINEKKYSLFTKSGFKKAHQKVEKILLIEAKKNKVRLT